MSISPIDRENSVEKVNVKSIRFKWNELYFIIKFEYLFKRICDNFQETELNKSMVKEISKNWRSQIDLGNPVASDQNTNRYETEADNFTFSNF
jgi:hypothetical protein